MNDHPAHRGDIVRRKANGTLLTVNSVDTDTRLLHTTWITGGPDIPIAESEVDVITPAGVA